MTALRGKRWGHYLQSGDYAMLSPAAAKLNRILILNAFMDIMMLVLGTVLAVPVSQTIANAWDCSRHTVGKKTEPAYFLDEAWDAGFEDVLCYDESHLLENVPAVVL